MLISINNEKTNQDVKSITVQLTDEVDIEISVNKFGELLINKQQFGEGESSIIIKPRVSNEIIIS